MNVRTLKHPAARYDVDYSQRYNLQSWGENNLYPQHLMRITQASGTAELCLNRYAKFIEGDGFKDSFAGVQFNRYGTTADELLHNIAQDVARFGGFALHINYNALLEPCELQHIPFEQCRLEECDDAGYVSHICLHPDWQGKVTRNGEKVRLEEKNIDRIAVFNPDKWVVARQIADAGSISQYKGQVLWCSMAGRNEYPLPIYDACVSDISTDEGLGNIKNRNARNNFLVSCMLVTKKGVPHIDENGHEVTSKMISDEDLLAFQGDERVAKIMSVELENDEDKPEVIPFPNANYDKDFSVTDSSVIERIYAQFHQELFHAIRIGKLGFSGDVMRDAYEYYAGEVTNEQRFISRNLSLVLSAWADPLLHNADTTILSLRYLKTE